ncbi:MAG: hypothetical protein AAF497_14670, partial [Planctomycetota bacterium]
FVVTPSFTKVRSSDDMKTKLAVQQYRGTFRQVRSAASATSMLLYVVGAFAAFAFATTLGEIATMRAKLPWLGLLLPMLGVAMAALCGGWLNWEWQRRLPDNVNDAGWRFSILEALAAMTAIGFLTAVASSLVRSAPSKYAEGVPVIETPFVLPDDATDVSYCHGVRGTIAYEFSVCESSFRDWVASGIGSIESSTSDTKLKPITTPISITRYIALSSDLIGARSVTIAGGLHYSWSFEDRGVNAVFDAATSRAYYFAHYH